MNSFPHLFIYLFMYVFTIEAQHYIENANYLLARSMSHFVGCSLSFCFFLLLFFFTLSFIFTSFREQDEAYMNSLRWSALVGLEPAYTRM